MAKCKYIVVQLENQYPAPILFPDFLTHADVAQALGGEVLSAGFVSFGETGVVPFGESLSLNLRSRPEDKDLLAWALGTTQEE